MQHSTEAFYEEKHLLLIGKGNRLNYGGLSVYHGEMFTSWNIYCIVSLMTTIEAMKLSQICPMNFIIWVWNLDVVFHLAPPLCLPIFYYLVSIQEVYMRYPIFSFCFKKVQNEIYDFNYVSFLSYWIHISGSFFRFSIENRCQIRTLNLV